MDVLALDRGVFVSEGDRVRYMDLASGTMYTLAGGLIGGKAGQGGNARLSLLRKPYGLALRYSKPLENYANVDVRFGNSNLKGMTTPMELYFAENGNH